MAVPSLDPAAAALLSATNVERSNDVSVDFNIFDDQSALGGSIVAARANIAPPPLPSGRCNYVDMSLGFGGAQCGCRRFWSKTSAARTSVAASLCPSNNNGTDASQTNWCMCSHHACYHDHAPSVPPPSGISSEQPAPASIPSSAGVTSAAFQETHVLMTPKFGPENRQSRPNKRSPLVEDVKAVQGSTDADEPMGDQTAHDAHAPLNALGNISFGFPTGMLSVAGSSFADLIADAAVETASSHASSMALASAMPLPDSEPLAVTPPPAPLSVMATSVAPSVIGPVMEGSIPDTMSWGSHGGPREIFAPPPSAGPSQKPPPSVASSTSQRYLRPFSGRGLYTLNASASTSLLNSLPPPPENSAAEAFSQAHSAQRTNASSVSMEPRNNLSGVIQAHETRLEKLENPSFSLFTGHEECQDKHDHLDLRVTELESRVDEVEKRLNNDDTSTAGGGGSIVFTRRHLVGREDDATTSSTTSIPADATTSIASHVFATAEAATSTTTLSADRAEIFSQLQALQTQVSLLQSSSLPSFNSPWELEVVFLPFPLKGIWVEASQFPTTSAVAAAAAAQRRQLGGGAKGTHDDDEWTQNPDLLGQKTLDSRLPGASTAADWVEWLPGVFDDAACTVPSYSNAPRLLPRACAPGRVIDSRLKSRGLVKTLSVRGADARSLQLAIAAAFGPFFRVSASVPLRSATAYPNHTVRRASQHHAHFLGLQQPWAPLRKVHKDSRLRFLTQAEMLTPAVWDAAFLMSSVVMKASGLQRLYVTHPDAYLQDRHAYKHGWSWQRLRELGLASENAPAPGLGRNSGALSMGDSTADPCWAWDCRLDDPPSSSPSWSSHNRASPSPFSRDATPTRANLLPHLQQANPSFHAVTTSALPTSVPGQAFRSSSRGVSGSPQQYFTVAQSPMNYASHALPTTSSVFRRSTSPFASADLSRARSSAKSVHRPPPIRTASMPAPPAREQWESPAGIAPPSPGGVGRRHVRSDSHRGRLSASSMHGHQTAISAYDERQPSPYMARPSPRLAALPSPSVHTNTGHNGVENVREGLVTSYGVRKHRRSTRSPSVAFWPRNTPRRSMSRSSSVVQILTVPVAAWAAEKQPRGSTPFYYATPYSNAPNIDAPVSASSSRRHWQQGNQEPYRMSDEYDNGDDDDGNYFDNDQMLGYDSKDELEYQMLQDDDDDIEVYEDEADALDDLGDLRNTERDVQNRGLLSRGYQQALHQHAHIPPEDEPWPGIEDDGHENSHENLSRHRFTSNHSHSNEDRDEDMSDSENMNPLSFEAEMGENNEQRPEANQQVGDHDSQDDSQHSGLSSQPSEYPITHAWHMPGMGGASAVSTVAPASGHAGENDKPRDGVLEQERPSHFEGSAIGDESGIGFKIHEDGDADVSGA